MKTIVFVGNGSTETNFPNGKATTLWSAKQRIARSRNQLLDVITAPKRDAGPSYPARQEASLRLAIMALDLAREALDGDARSDT